jgi:hypothetical protein
MEAHHKWFPTIAAVITIIVFLTGASSWPKLKEWLVEGWNLRGTPETSPAVTGQGVPPGCLRFDESGEQVGLWRDECEQCRTGNTFDLRCIREKGIDPFQTPPRPAASTAPVP